MKKTIYISPGKSDNDKRSTANSAADFDNESISTANSAADFDNESISIANSAADFDNESISTANSAADFYNESISTANEMTKFVNMNILREKESKVFGNITEYFIRLILILKSLKEINIKEKNRKISKTGLKDPEIKQFIADADAYLHYANGIMFFICNFRNASEVIAIRICTAADMIRALLIIFETASARRKFYFKLKAERANAFDGVIERYCGVPP
ncbi:MAG: hypothetical protein KDD00_15920 [Ignavibacteriae bacterium]|nr:hypothetical protein [Ignavibacteriota bacterium]